MEIGKEGFEQKNTQKPPERGDFSLFREVGDFTSKEAEKVDSMIIERTKFLDGLKKKLELLKKDKIQNAPEIEDILNNMIFLTDEIIQLKWKDHKLKMIASKQEENDEKSEELLKEFRSNI